MTDILIRNVPDDVVAEIDSQAERIGLSRVEYVRRQLLRESTRTRTTITPADLTRSAARLHDLLDVELMDAAWQ
ncbi:type II toxin-antitoxin system VapB family antitoxin [Herbiconiux sp. YIM B11900]|uniref:type II toxin-antitoxin system VapB family antitoxin n=1 Tax=Herbiconiux sp. YIM B11900 TaxID=3404131 RepID=UPI003F85B953